jgi:hypothetical protein
MGIWGSTPLSTEHVNYQSRVYEEVLIRIYQVKTIRALFR